MKFGLGGKSAIGILTILALLTVFIGSAVPASAATTKYVLTVKQTANEKGTKSGGPYTLTVYVTPVGSSTTVFTVEGQVTGVAANPAYVGGTGMVSGTNLILNLVMTLDDTTNKERTGADLQVTLNKSTLKGTYWWVGSRFLQTATGQTAFQHKYSTGTVSK